MTEESTSRFGPTFLVYTALGYLALALHFLVFVPGHVEGSGRTAAVLLLLNLAAGAWCFLRALRVAWGVRLRMD
jgi:hypothetical protein